MLREADRASSLALVPLILRVTSMLMTDIGDEMCVKDVKMLVSVLSISVTVIH